MKKHYQLATMVLLEHARKRLYDRPIKEKELTQDNIFYDLCSMMDSRIAGMKPDKAILDEKNQLHFRFRASIIEFDTKMLEIIMDEVPSSKGKYYNIYNDPSNAIIDTPGFLASDYMKILEKTIQEFERSMDEEGRRLYKTSFEISKDKNTASFEIIFRVTPRNMMAMPEYGSC